MNKTNNLGLHFSNQLSAPQGRNNTIKTPKTASKAVKVKQSMTMDEGGNASDISSEHPRQSNFNVEMLSPCINLQVRRDHDEVDYQQLVSQFRQINNDQFEQVDDEFEPVFLIGKYKPDPKSFKNE